MQKLGKVLTAYIIASLAAIVAGWVGLFFVAEIWRVRVSAGLFVAGVWLLIVGLPSMFASVGYLLRQLGASGRAIPWLGHTGSRTIPLGMNLAHTSPSIFTGNGRPEAVELKRLEIRAGEYVISHQVLEGFLKRSWAMQQRGGKGLSRSWWVHERKILERGEYDALVNVLEQYGVIIGRGPRRSGKLAMSPIQALDYLEERV